MSTTVDARIWLRDLPNATLKSSSEYSISVQFPKNTELHIEGNCGVCDDGKTHKYLQYKQSTEDYQVCMITIQYPSPLTSRMLFDDIVRVNTDR